MSDFIPAKASANLSGAAAGASPVSSTSAQGGVSSPGELRPPKPPFSRFGVIALWLFGIILPTVTLLLEVTKHLCADAEIFDPIPTWWHVALIALVPCVNLATWLAIRQQRARWFRPLAHLNAVALGVSAVYATLFLPLTPFAFFGIILGVGLLALAPLFSFLALRTGRGALRRAQGARGSFPRVWPGLLAGVAALAIPEAPRYATRVMLATAASEDAAQSRRGVDLLRRFGSRGALLGACYQTNEWWNPMSMILRWEGTEGVAAETARKIFFRVTGEPFNATPAPVSASLGRRGFWNDDDDLGGTRVAGKLPGLSMTSSRLDGKIEAAAGLSYVEWTLVFKNVARNQSEARAQLELPPGGVVSRLTLWIDGEPREAAFGGRAQVREAYREVAVQQRRDPVLVTTAGPDRVLMQCFPVPPNGGEMKVRVGITAPLQLLGDRSGTATLPRFLETNFEPAAGLAHEVWLESDQPLDGAGSTVKRSLAEAELAAGPRWIAGLPVTAGDRWAEDPTDAQFLIRQTVRREPSTPPRRVVFVVDGSSSMAGELRLIADHLRKMPAGMEFAIVFAGDEPEVFAASRDPGAAAAWLLSRQVAGGRDNLPALERAWDFSATQAGGAIVWLHGPQPVLLSSAERLLQRTERERTPPTLYDVAFGATPNRILEQLDKFRGVHPIRSAPDLGGNLAHLFALWRGELPEYTLALERVPRSEASADLVRGSGHIARLWGAREIQRLLAASEPGGLERAMKLAIQLQLVTPASGAVVLERKEQYDRHGLTPADSNTVPTIPEPGSALLFLAGAAALLARRNRSRPASIC